MVRERRGDVGSEESTDKTPIQYMPLGHDYFVGTNFSELGM